MINARAAIATLAAALACAAPSVPAAAQIIVTGHHDSNPALPWGYYAGSGQTGPPLQYLVPADTGTALDATFNYNVAAGFESVFSNVTVNGGQFIGSAHGFEAIRGSQVSVTAGRFSSNQSGLYTYLNAAATITGGQFNSNTNYGLDAEANTSVTITGGQFNNNKKSGVYALSATVIIGGGQFSGNSYRDLYADSSSVIDLFGTNFHDSIGHVYNTGDKITSGSGILYGTLLDGEAFTASYEVPAAYPVNGTIEFNVGPAPAPEPSAPAALGMGVAGLGLLTATARRRRPASSTI